MNSRISKLRNRSDKDFIDVNEQRRITRDLEKARKELPGQHPAELTGILIENAGNFKKIHTTSGGALAAVRERNLSKYAYRVMDAARDLGNNKAVLELRHLTKNIYRLEEKAIKRYFGPGTAAEAQLADEARDLVAKLRETTDKAMIEARRLEARASTRAGR